MKTILAYGDSITWGFIPDTGERHAFDDRWPSVLAASLGNYAHVIADGLCGRTTAYDDYSGDCNRNASQTLPTALAANGPLDLVVLMLGLNDLQPHIAGSALAAVQGLERLVRIAKKHDASNAADILIVAPPHLTDSDDDLYALYFEGTAEQSRDLAPHFERLAKQYECYFLDASQHCKASKLDGVHLDAATTKQLGLAIAKTARTILND